MTTLTFMVLAFLNGGLKILIVCKLRTHQKIVIYLVWRRMSKLSFYMSSFFHKTMVIGHGMNQHLP